MLMVPHIPVSSGALIFAPARTFSSVAVDPSTAATTRTWVTKILPAGLANIVAFGGSSIKVRVTAPASATCVITDTFVGLSSTDVSKPWDFASTPTRITWSGGNTLTAAAGSTVFSDAATFYPPTGAAISIAVNLPAGSIILFNGSPSTPAPAPAGTNFIRYSKASVSEAGSATKGSGYSASSSQSGGIHEILVA